MENYVVALDSFEEELFEVNGDNVIGVRVCDNKGIDISKECRVQIEFSKNALLGFATELIRLAHNYQDGKHTHLHPVEESLISQNMGVYLTPESSELIVDCNDFKPIEEYLGSAKQTQY